MRIGEDDPIYIIPAKTRQIGMDMAAKHGLTYDMLLIMVWLRGAGQTTITKGGNMAGYNPEAFRRLLYRLVKSGFVEVEENSKGPNVYHLSKKGDYVIRGYTLLMRRALNETK